MWSAQFVNKDSFLSPPIVDMVYWAKTVDESGGNYRQYEVMESPVTGKPVNI